MTSDDDLRDHFERQYAQGGPSAGMARAVLDLMDERDSAKESLAELPDRIGTVAEAVRDLEILDSLTVWAQRDVTFQEFGELDEDTLERFARAYDGHEQQSFALQELCVEAGLLALNDHETDPIPLIRMFLPIEGD